MFTFPINIFGQYLTSTKLFSSEELAKQGLDSYIDCTKDNFPGIKIIGFIHRA